MAGWNPANLISNFPIHVHTRVGVKRQGTLCQGALRTLQALQPEAHISPPLSEHIQGGCILEPLIRTAKSGHCN